jgi:hypothetical protein
LGRDRQADNAPQAMTMQAPPRIAEAISTMSSDCESRVMNGVPLDNAQASRAYLEEKHDFNEVPGRFI